MKFERTNLGPVRTDVSALWDLAAHDASIMCDLMAAAPVSVTATGQSYLNSGIEDVVSATFIFDTGASAHIHASWLHPNKVRQVTIVGTKKMIVFDDLNPHFPVRLYDKRIDVVRRGATDTFLVIDNGTAEPLTLRREPLTAEIDDFLDSIVLGRQPRANGYSGLRVVRMMEAANTSMAHKSAIVPIDFPPEA